MKKLESRLRRDAPVPDPRGRAGELDSLHRHTILFVDDCEPIRRIMARTLKQAGFLVLEAGSGKEALEIVEGHPQPFDLLITDVRLPSMHGTELLAEVRTLQPELPALFISGAGVEDSAETFLAKPFRPEDLLRTVRDLLDLRG